MAKTKIVLFIVEGPSEESALGPGLEDLLVDNVKFKVMHWDITSDYDSTADNVEKRIRNLAVKKFLEKNAEFTYRDICGIVQVVDTDGIFVDNSQVHTSVGLPKVQYYKDHIEVNEDNYDDFLRTRAVKKSVLEHLITLTNIKIPYGKIVPYEVYYMSNNLDNVLGLNMNATEEEKMDLSIEFGDEHDTAEKLSDFFNDSHITPEGDYNDTWLFIKEGNNSLGRYSNLSVFINKYFTKGN